MSNASLFSLSGRQPHVYLLHGWAPDQYNDQKWQPFQEELAALGVKSTFLPIPGLSAPLDEVWNLDDYVRWLEGELRGQKDVVLLGHSFGGQLSIRYAAQHPQQLRRLILVAASGIRDQSFKGRSKRLVFGVLAKIGKVLFPIPLARQLLYKLARERDYLNAPPLLRRTMSLILSQEVLADAAQVSCPTLLIWGELDRVTPLKNGSIYQQTLPVAELKIIAGARHSPQFTHTKKVAAAVATFLKQKVVA